MMTSESQKTRDIQRKLAAIGGAVAVVGADITKLLAEFETIQDVPVDSVAKHDVDDDDTSHKTEDEEVPVDLSTHKKSRSGESNVVLDEVKPLINGLIQTVNCLADALKRNPDQDYADRLFAEVMKTEHFDEDFLVKAFDYLNQNPVHARSFIAKRQNMRRDWLMRSASKWLGIGNDYSHPSYYKPPSIFANSGGQFGPSASFGAGSAPCFGSGSSQAFGASAQQSSFGSGAQNPFGASRDEGRMQPLNGFTLN